MKVKSNNAKQVAEAFVNNYPIMFQEHTDKQFWIRTIAAMLHDFRMYGTCYTEKEIEEIKENAYQAGIASKILDSDWIVSGNIITEKQ